jgi:hypothetical protein
MVLQERGCHAGRAGENGEAGDLAPTKFAAQSLGPGHRKIAYAHRKATLSQDLVPVPSPTTPAPTEFESPALAAAAVFPPEVACHPQLDGPRATREAANCRPTDHGTIFVANQCEGEVRRGPTDGL